MAYTKVSDIIQPEVFTANVIDMSAELSQFWQSGIISTVSDLGENFSQGGATVNMPFWDDLAGEDQLLDEDTDLIVQNLSMGQDVAVWHGRALVYGGTDLAQALNNNREDPVSVVVQRMAAKWVRQQNRLAIATLKGAMGALAAESPSVNTLDISALSGTASHIDGAAFIDANQQMGENKDRLVAVAMHSAVNAYLAKQGLIETERDVNGVVLYESFMGKRVVVDDRLEPSNGTYETFLFGEGALGYAEGSPKVPTETDRDPLTAGGQEFLVSRRHFVLHPRGVKWSPASGVPAKQTPSNAELADAGNWQRVWDAANIRIVRLVHTIG